MKPCHLLPLTLLLGSLIARAQSAATPFNSGSSGALGDLLVTNAVVIALPPDGVLHYRRVEIATNGAVTFLKNPMNTPVTLLAQQEILITGDVYVSGSPAEGGDPGRGGPGGFDGGRGASNIQPAGPGKGPGGASASRGYDAGSGAYGDRGDLGDNRSRSAGQPYGDPLLLSIIGGSGGGGREECYCGGGGGGGAILIASSIRILLPSPGHGVWARGGDAYYNAGSGGAIRLVAPVVEGTGHLDCYGGAHGASGRIRVDSPNTSRLALDFGGYWSIGSLMLTRLPVEPKLNIVKIGDRDIAQDANGTVSVVFPNGTPQERIVRIQARDFGSVVPIRLALVPDFGDRILVDAEIDNTGAGAASVNVPATFPLNVAVTVNVWTR